MDHITNESTVPEDSSALVKSTVSFMVVGIGASAGGLRALLAFFEKMPADNDVVFVMVLHLSPAPVSCTRKHCGRSTATSYQHASGPSHGRWCASSDANSGGGINWSEDLTLSHFT